MISIIIPTLNEEKRLPRLLASIRKQDFNDYEIIVADAGSSDKTADIAKAYGCRVVKGGLPAFGRNQGAKSSRGETSLFLDADVVLPRFFLRKALAEFGKRELEIAGFFLLPDKPDKTLRFLFKLFYNLPISSLERVLPHAAMAIMVQKKFFGRLGGFDETIKLAEDHDLARRAVKKGKYGLIQSTKVFISPRRFEKDGWMRTYGKYLLAELHMIFVGPIKSDAFKYKFNHYKDRLP